MNIILISDDRIKVILTDSDLSGYGIKVEDIDYDNTETKRVFWTILDKAKSETGFDAALSRLFIQIYPDSCGGCEMYVSRIGEKRTATRGDGVRCAIENGGTVNKKQANAKKSEYVYRFENTELMLSACKLLRQSGFSEKADAYVTEGNADGACYLIIQADRKWQTALAEYGESCSGRYDKWRLAERYAHICSGNAVEALGNL